MGPEVDQKGKRTSRYKRSSSFWPSQEDTREQTVKLLEDKSVGSLRIAKRKLFQSGIDDGRSTIHQIAQERGKRYKKRRRKPLLTERQKEERLKFAKREKKKNSEVYK